VLKSPPIANLPTVTGKSIKTLLILNNTIKETIMTILNCCINTNTKFDWVTISTLITAFTALGTGIYSILHSRKTTYINAVTTSRLKYIESLRGYISQFCGLILFNANNQFDEIQKKEFIEKVDQLRFTIKLHLNRKNVFDKKLLEQLDSIPNFIDHDKTEELTISINQLVNYAQDIFSLEWDGIKLEAAKGALTEEDKNELLNKHILNYGK
jgi:hypothetical protein